MRTKAISITIFLLTATPALAQTELTVTPGQPIAATIDGKPVRLRVGSARLDRLTLDPDYVAANAIRPAPMFGGGTLEVAGRQEFKGHNRPLTYTVAGLTKKARAFWFDAAPDSGVDGSIGPFGLPQDRVSFVLAPAVASEEPVTATLQGNIDGSGYVGFRIGDGGTLVDFDVESPERYPVASAATGALLARTFGGELSGASWDVEILLGVRRPVRLLTLARPFVFGSWSFGKIAVRVRDRIDAGGRGTGIADADAPADPSEIVVEARAKGPQPLYSLSIPRKGLTGCSRLTYDKAAMKIELSCRR